MITNSPNNIEKHITRVLKGSQECHRLYGGDKLIFSPYTLMGTTYHSSNEVIWSRGSASSVASDLYSIFEILGEAGTDEGGTYYNFGWRVTGLRRNGTQATQEQFEQEITHFFSTDVNHPLCTYFRSINLYSNSMYRLRLISPLQQNLTTLKEVDFKDFSTREIQGFQPCRNSITCASLLNLNKLVFTSITVHWREAFRKVPVVEFDLRGITTLYHLNNTTNGWYYTFADCELCEAYYFSRQDNDNVVTALDGTWHGNKVLEELNIDPLRFKNLASLNSTWAQCYALKDIPFTTETPTASITSWSQTFRWCRALNPTNWDAISFNSAVSLYYMLHNCISLVSVNWSDKDMHTVGNIDASFYDCRNLTNIVLPSATNKRLAPTYASNAFRETKITSIPDFDFDNLLTLDGGFQNCTELTGSIDLSNKNMSTLNNINALFGGCIGITSITFPTGAKSTSSLMHAVSSFQGCSGLESIDNLDLTNVDTISNLCKACSNLKQVTGSKPTVPTVIDDTLTSCGQIQRFIDLRNIRLKNESWFSIGNLPANADDLHIETWTAEDGVSKPIVVGRTDSYQISENRTVVGYNGIDFTGWTFLSGVRTSGAVGFLYFRCKVPFNLNGIKVRMVQESANNTLIALNGYTAFSYCEGLTSIDTTTWIDNSEIPSLNKVVINTNGGMFSNCTNLTSIKLKNIMLAAGYSGLGNNNDNINTFLNCSNVSSFECDVDFINTTYSNICNLAFFTQWTNATEIRAFLEQLTTTYSLRYLDNNSNSIKVQLSSQTYVVASGFADWNTIVTSAAAHGWEIV